jgi:TPR repeat protein
MSYSSMSELRQAAEQGDAKAQLLLGVCYEYGEGVAKDMAQAAEWYRKAAEQGDADAQRNLGVCYEDGLGVPKDMAQAVAWYRKAADQGLAGAQCLLGLRYDTGEGVAQDKAQAVAWYRKAAEQGLAGAQYLLGFSYATGDGVPEDKAQAVAWWRKAAEQGHAEAQCTLGLCYYNGEGVPRDRAQALEWYSKGARQEHRSKRRKFFDGARLFLALLMALFIGFVVHEAGHLAAYKSYGVGVDEYRIFLGTEVCSVELGETKYSVGNIPIAAYVVPVQPHYSDNELRAMASRNPARAAMFGDPGRSAKMLSHFQELVVYGMGPCANFLLAWLLFFVVLMAERREALQEECISHLSCRDALVQSTRCMHKGIWVELKRMVGNLIGKPKDKAGGAEISPFSFPLLQFVARISLVLGVVNLLVPIPPLDGGKIWLALFEWMGWHVSDNAKSLIFLVGLLLVVAAFWVVPLVKGVWSKF